MLLPWSAVVVASGAQALLAGYVAVELLRGARTPARRTLGRVMAGLSLYSVSFLRTSVDSSYDPLDLVTLLLAMGSTAELVALARWQARGADPSAPTALPRWAQLAIVAASIAPFLWTVASGGWGESAAARTGTLLLVLLLIVLFTIAAAGFAVAAWRGVKGSGTYLVATMFPLVTTVANVFVRAGASVGAYMALRDVAILFYALVLFVAYLDHGKEPMSLGSRIVAGALTAVLTLATAAARLLGPVVARGGPDVAADFFAQLFILECVSAALVVVVLPRLFRATVLGPLERLTGGLAAFEAGRPVALPVEHQDEIGRVTVGFNAMVTAIESGRVRLREQLGQLEARRGEVESLNEELRRQVAARSRQLAEVLAQASPRGGWLEPGAIVDGRYRVEDRLGAGGMGVVYAVTRMTDDRPLALKVMASATSSEDAVRFAREAEIAATLDHPNLVGVIDVGMHGNIAWLVMERVDGGSLEDARPRFGDVAWAEPLIGQIAAGLAALHQRGVVHRDLKPANVLLARDGARTVARITDFGIARRDDVGGLAVDPSGDAPTAPAALKTATGVIIGTLAYIAPELARRGRPFQGPADVFALGIVAHEMLCGSHPFRVPPLLEAIAGRAPERTRLPSSVPAAVGAVIDSCLDLDPAARPSAADVARALGA